MSIINDDTVPGLRINPHPDFEWPTGERKNLIGYRMVRDKLTTALFEEFTWHGKEKAEVEYRLYLGLYNININDSFPLVEVLP